MKTVEPTLNQDYAMISEDEGHMSSSFGITGGRGDLIAMQVDRGQPYRGKKPFMQCTHCGLKGNMKEKCYQLIGYPADWKGKKVMANAVTVDTNVGRSVVAQERVTPGHYYKGEQPGY